MELTPKQELFCLEYAATGNATQSYIKAGYKVKNENAAAACAAKLLRNAKIQARLQELPMIGLSQEEAKKKIADLQEVQEKLTNILRQNDEEEVVVVEGQGDGVSRARTVQKKASLMEAIRAAELLAKLQGGLTKNINLTGSVPVVITGEGALED